jgi:arsenate reductase
MIQIFGTPGSRDTQKAVRFFKERRVPFQFIDLSQKAMSRGELASVARSVSPDRLLDRESALYKKMGLAYQEYDPVEKLLEQPLLFVMPVVREGNKAAVGPAVDEWLSWLGK